MIMTRWLEGAARIAVESVREEAGDLEVTFVLFGQTTFSAFESALNG